MYFAISIDKILYSKQPEFNLESSKECRRLCHSSLFYGKNIHFDISSFHSQTSTVHSFPLRFHSETKNRSNKRKKRVCRFSNSLFNELRKFAKHSPPLLCFGELVNVMASIVTIFFPPSLGGIRSKETQKRKTGNKDEYDQLEMKVRIQLAYNYGP